MNSGGKVLVVDDSEASLKLLVDILSAEGYQARPADSGELALSAVRVDPPELILLDMRMPGVDGVEVCRRLKSSSETRDIPVIFLSSSVDFEDRLEGLECGAVDFINKPFHREELLARLKTHLELARLQKDLEHRVAQRTAELQAANSQLQTELEARKRIEEELRESEHRFRTVADTAPAALWMTDPEGLITYMSQGGLTFSGLTGEQVAGKGWLGAIHPEDVDSTIKAMSEASRDRSRYQIELRLRKWNGQYGWTAATGIPLFMNREFAGHIGITIDITELKLNQERALANQKLESLGVLAAGIAHDFNNLLSTILAHADLAQDETPATSPARENISTIATVALHASEIVALLMDYAGSADGGAQEPVKITSVIQETVRLLQASLPKTSSLQMNLSLPDSQLVRANPGHIRQIVLNLVINASEALEGQLGIITVSTAIARVGQKSAEPRPAYLNEDDYVVLEVADSGCGMTEDVKARIFDPFYSSKALGRGLGLASLRGIVRGMEGAVQVTSSPGVGSTFKIWLPCWDREPEAEVRIPRAGSNRTGTILLVEDEDLLRTAVSRALQREGFLVMAARDGVAAVDLFARHLNKIEVIVLDLTLPLLSGRDVCEKIRGLKTDVQVLFTSAQDSINKNVSNGQTKERFLRKPYRLKDLIHTLREMMPSPGEGDQQLTH